MTGQQSVRFLFDFALVGMGVLGIIVEPIMLSGDQGSYWFGRHWSCGIQSSWFFILGALKYRAWLAWRINSTAIASQSQLLDIVWYSWILELFLLRRLLAVHVMQRNTTIAFPDSLPPLAGAETPFAKILVVRSFRLLRLVRVNHSDLGSFRSEKSKKNHCRNGEWFTVERLVMTIWLTCPYECYPCYPKAIRMLHMFRTVWRLVYGLLTSGNAMLSTFFILLLTLYIFACLGIGSLDRLFRLQQTSQTCVMIRKKRP